MVKVSILALLAFALSSVPAITVADVEGEGGPNRAAHPSRAPETTWNIDQCVLDHCVQWETVDPFRHIRCQQDCLKRLNIKALTSAFEQARCPLQF